ncbi:MAG: hypothetical protein ABIO38_04695 [Luteimonas sp.]
MNSLKTTSQTKPNPMPAQAPRRQPPRTRDFGVGYGNSSGYASERRYTSDWSQIRFRMG